jgi:hypothetical protein
MSVDICCPHSAFQVVVRKPGKKSKFASPQKDLRERVIAALFATLHDELVPSLSFEDVIVPSSTSDDAGSQKSANKLSDSEMALEDPSPSGGMQSIHVLSQFPESNCISPAPLPLAPCSETIPTLKFSRFHLRICVDLIK